jgi:DNA segregation ATPase FtsK/SpoIIIE, S-DNA-T family
MELSHFFRSRRGNELVGVVILAVGVTIALSLVTYHPDDSSAFYTSTRDQISNAIGYYGATLAWLFVGFFGMASLLFPAALLLLGWNRFWGREVEFFKTKFLGFLVLAVSMPPLLDLLIGDRWFRGALVPAGGYIGTEIRSAIAANLNATGAGIALVTIFVVGLLLATRISLAEIFLWLQETLSSLWRGLVLQWSRLTERRRKERMKTEVVRKHLEQVATAEGGQAVPAVSEDEAPVVREIRGRGRFQIRRVTRADLRRVASDLVREAPDDVMEMYQAESRSEPEWAQAFEPEIDADRPVRPEKSTGEREGELIEDAVAFKPRRKKEATSQGARSLSSERLPYPNLLKPGSGEEQLDEAAHRRYMETGKLIEERCAEFSVEGEVTAYHPGPVVSTFEFKPSAGVKYSRVVNLSDDLALALEAESIRIERISGSSTVGIEIPNKERDLIALRDLIDTGVFRQSQSLLTLALGKDIHGEPVVADLAKMPHLLVAGATGAGKSVGLNSMILSLLYKTLPKELRLLMIDPKMVELKVYEDIPHLLHPIVTDPKLAATALVWTVQEMENRYRTLAGCGVRNIVQFNELLRDPEKAASRAARAGIDMLDDLEPMEYIVVVIDEFADLMMVASKEVEDSVTRLAQKARAVGIHLIIATQRPSVDVITGVIKANFPARISYQVASKIDSRTILDTQGAEKLLGNGDMLFLPPGTARMRRLHGAYVSEREISDVVDFVKKCQGGPDYIEEITRALEEKESGDGIELLDDPKYDDAVRVILSTGQASASYLQRRLKLGYSRAARLVEMMEANGIVGPSQGSKPREILIREDDYPPVHEAR